MADELALDSEYDMYEEEDTQKGRFMTFKLGNEYYGIGINYINEIIGIQQITEIPETVDYIKGLINLRGKIIPVIDVRMRFQKSPLEYDGRTCVIVITVDETVIGLIVDTIAEVITIPDENILSPPKSGKMSNRFVYGLGKIGNDVKLLIDPDRLINEDSIAYEK